QREEHRIKQQADDPPRAWQARLPEEAESLVAGIVDQRANHCAGEDHRDKAQPRVAQKLRARVAEDAPAQLLEEPPLAHRQAEADVRQNGVEFAIHDASAGCPSCAASSVSFRKTSSSEPSRAACLRSVASVPRPMSRPRSTMPMRSASSWATSSECVERNTVTPRAASWRRRSFNMPRLRGS